MGLNPLVIEQMHVDQVLLLMCDKRLLAGNPRLVTGTPQELKAKGFIDQLPEMSYVQSLRQRMERERAERDAKQDRRDRREQRRQETVRRTEG